MVNQIKSWCNYCNLPDDACQEFTKNYLLLTSDSSNKKVFDSVLKTYDDNMLCDFEALLNDVRALAEKTNVHPYTAIAIMYICMSESLKKHYVNNGYPLEIYLETVKDVSFHARYCKLVKGFWGTFTTWHTMLYKMEIFGFGRLQVQPKVADFDYHENGFNIIKDKTVFLNLHIPRTQTPLDYDECEKSLKKAYEFFKDKYFTNEKVLFYCKSWLLFSKHTEMLKPTSNIRKFMDRFTIVENGFYDNYSEIWRFFDVEYNGNPDDLPQDSSIRRAYVNLIKNGEKTGWARGVFYYNND